MKKQVIVAGVLLAVCMAGCAAQNTAPAPAEIPTATLAPTEVPAPTPAQTSEILRFAHVEAAQPAWPDTEIINVELPNATLPYEPGALVGRFAAPAEHRAGYAVAQAGGTVEFYTTADDGVTWQQQSADLSAAFGGAQLAHPRRGRAGCRRPHDGRHGHTAV